MSDTAAVITVIHTAIVPDEKKQIRAALCNCGDERKIGLILKLPGSEKAARDMNKGA